jgi:hypothetical protein
MLARAQPAGELASHCPSRAHRLLSRRPAVAVRLARVSRSSPGTYLACAAEEAVHSNDFGSCSQRWTGPTT